MIEIAPIRRVNATVEVPGSKSLTQRALIAAALARGTSTLIGPLASEDTEFSSRALAQLGVAIDRGHDWRVSGGGGVIGQVRRLSISATTAPPPGFSLLWSLWVKVNMSSTGMSACTSDQSVR
jgi:5-enolpyruvylshikimate-3-phosphate synthase